jgi:hypothetical protein
MYRQTNYTLFPAFVAAAVAATIYTIYKCIYFFSGCIPAEELKFVMNNLPGKVS